MRLKIQSGHIKTPGLVNFWSFNSHIKDVIGGAHLFNGINAGLTEDRFGRPLSALNLNGGSYQLPSVNYFPTGRFTITVWIKLRQYGIWPSILTFWNGFKIDSIFLGFYSNSSNPEIAMYNNNTMIIDSVSTLAIQLNVWTHLAVTFDQLFNTRVFVNANLTKISNWNKPLKNITRLFNYIGRGENLRPFLNGIIDELKLFNRALSQKEIQFEMNNNFY